MTTVVLPRRLRLPVAVPVAIGSAWLLALGAQVTGYGGSLHHDQLIEEGPPIWLALAMFLLAWQVMIAAMMVPTSLPLAQLFDAASRRQPRPGIVMAAFLGGYALVWSAFGLTAFVADVGVHQLADRSAFLGSHEALITGGTLAVAGAFQFTRLKKRCLTECRHPVGFLAAHYQRGVGGAFRLGRKHGTFCVGCCAGLMLVMFAAGIANLLWMATLTVLMAYEKNGHAGSRLVSAVGCALLLWAAAVLVAPSWLPPLFAGEL
ncbi:conserved hypothetical protein (plasmid) [Nocardioides sp. JS614]|nr:conserved hypothetical protein [Nocardioides sp. JS614]